MQNKQKLLLVGLKFDQGHQMDYPIAGYFYECLISAYFRDFIKRAEVKIADNFN